MKQVRDAIHVFSSSYKCAKENVRSLESFVLLVLGLDGVTSFINILMIFQSLSLLTVILLPLLITFQFTPILTTFDFDDINLLRRTCLVLFKSNSFKNEQHGVIPTTWLFQFTDDSGKISIFSKWPPGLDENVSSETIKSVTIPAQDWSSFKIRLLDNGKEYCKYHNIKYLSNYCASLLTKIQG
ncbi:Uncharacterized protein FWK35_00031425 [Aphis craccivora]|uniref:Uncharacterized protein n=1 Tax=Aphis craccivora TaxID=307492 RepID=A0A6G0VJA1_APHCR|nr:Uncharacterized protein FWK35_00031425 [Aphis craccivora]